jgi:hypothetical protein
LTRYESVSNREIVSKKPSQTKSMTDRTLGLKAEKEARLAAALRQNLRRRKTPVVPKTPESGPDEPKA